MKKKKLFPFVIKMIFLFVLVLWITGLGSGIMYNIVTFSKYGIMMWMEALMALIMLIVMLLSGNKYVFTEEKEKFGKSLKRGMPILVVSFIALLVSTITLIDQKEFNFINFLTLLLLCASIGLFEEFLGRGWLQNEFIERFGNTRKGVIKSIVISSLFFGLMHIANVMAGQNLFETLMQVIQTTFLGLLLGAVYYKTKNIWSCVFLHGFYDFCLMMGNINYIKDPITSGGNIVSIFTSIFMSMIWIFGAIKFLQKSDIKKEELTEKDKLIEKKNRKLCNIMMIVSMIGFFLGTIIIPEDINVIEFNYKEKHLVNYTAHYPRYEDYKISYIVNDIEKVDLKIYENDDMEFAIKNINTNQEIVLDYGLYQYTVIDNVDYFEIMVYTFDYEIYCAKLDKVNMNNTLGYLESIKNNFKKYDVPELQDAGYITIDDSGVKYPYLLSQNFDKFMIIDEEMYLLK